MALSSVVAAAAPPPPPPPPPPQPAAAAPTAAAAVPIRVNRSAASGLPNLLLSTTYALNRSNSKKVAVGLEYIGGFYKPVVKLCSTGSPAKYVTLDKNAWELICDQIDAMVAYLEDSFTFYNDFGKPTKIYLPNHDINFSTAYGVKAIVIDERPKVPQPKPIRGNQPEAQVMDEESQFASIFATSDQQKNEEVQDSAITETPCKKKKYDNPPSIVMQQTTLNGLRDLRECVNEWLKRIEDNASVINQGIDNILEYLKKELQIQSMEKAKSLLKDDAAFKQFCALHKTNIINRASMHMEFVKYNKDLFDIALVELYAFGLINIAKDLNDIMFKA